ncbi:MAG: alpha/beta fold hydrolase [Gammaproteobacteria bacterium]
MTRSFFQALVALGVLCSPAWAADAEPPKAEPETKTTPKAEAKASPTGPVTVEEIMADAVSWGPNLSPSGRYLAILRNKGELNLIVIADLKDESAAPLVHTVPFGTVQWVSWANDDRLLFATAFWADLYGKPTTERALRHWERRRVVRLLSMDRDGKNLTMLFADNKAALGSVNLARVTDVLPKDPRNIVMPAWQYDRYCLYRVDIYTGASQMIAEGTTRTFLWFTDSDGYPAFRVDRNFWNTAALVYARKGPGNIAPAKLEWEEVLKIPLRDEDNESTPDFYPLAAGPDPTTYYVSARPDGADTSGIYLYDFVAKKYLKTLAVEPGIDIEDVFVDDETREFLGVRFYADRKVTRWVDPTRQAHLKALDKYFGGEVDIYLQGYDATQQTWLLFTIGPRDRGSWHSYRLKDRYVKELAHWLPIIDTKRLGTTKVVRYKARDGLEIMGYLTTPPNAPQDGPPPLIMLPHGGPEVRDVYEFDGFVQLLASRGYSVFQPNFRGSSGFGKRFADAGKRQWGGAMQDDLTDGFEFLVKSGYADRDKACIVGFSYGGYAALAAATQTPELYRCAASYAGISDLLLQIDHWKRRTRNNDEGWDYVKRLFGDPKTDEAMLEAHSPVRLADAVTVPVLLIHGKYDGTVPVKQSRIMDKALRKAGKDVRYIELENSDHNPVETELKQTYQLILDFLDKNLPATPAAPVPPPQAAATPEPAK